MAKLPASKQLLIFCVCFLIGITASLQVSFAPSTLTLLALLWVGIYFSGQNRNIELLSLVLSGLITGMLVWQLTGGEVWIHLRILSTVSDYLINWRDQVVDKIFMSLSEPHGSLLSGIIFGNKVKLSKELTDQFKIIGITHLIAVSGYNLTILTANIRTILRPFFGLKTFYLCLLAIVGFVIVTGAPASVLRAALMSGLFLLAEFRGRPSKSLNVLILGASVLIVFEPIIIQDIGFQLSIAATYGLLRLSPVIAYAISRLRLPGSVRDIISETVGATIMTTPIILFYFDRLSVVSPMANLLILPIVPLLMGLGIFGIVGLLIYQPIGNGLIMLSWPLLNWIVFLSNKLSDWRYASVNFSVNAWVFWLIMIAIIVGAEVLFAKYSNKNVEKLV